MCIHKRMPDLRGQRKLARRAVDITLADRYEDHIYKMYHLDLFKAKNIY